VTEAHIAPPHGGHPAFHVMDLLARARVLEAAGADIVHMEIGEPDFVTPQPIIAAGQRALADGRTHYTPACGLPELRAAISGNYRHEQGLVIAPERIVITPGASGRAATRAIVLIDPGDQVLMADPGYPCNRHFVRLVEGEAVGIAVTAATDFQLTAELVDRAWTSRTVAVAAGIAVQSHRHTRQRGRTRGDSSRGATARRRADRRRDLSRPGVWRQDAQRAALRRRYFVINSFSKYYG